MCVWNQVTQSVINKRAAVMRPKIASFKSEQDSDARRWSQRELWEGKIL